MHEVFILSCQEFPKTFPTTFQRLQNVVKNVQRCSDDLFNDNILVCCDKVERLFGLFSGILNLTLLLMC